MKSKLEINNYIKNCFRDVDVQIDESKKCVLLFRIVLLFSIATFILTITCFVLDIFIARVSLRLWRDFLALNIGGLAVGVCDQHSFIRVETSDTTLFEFQPGREVLGRIFWKRCEYKIARFDWIQWLYWNIEPLLVLRN